MKIKPYIDRLEESKEYKDFQKKHSDSFMIAGFFILDLETGQNIHTINYYVPSEKKIAAFTLDKGITMQMLDMMNSRIVPEKLDIKTNIDLDALHGILEDEMKNRSITEEIKKIMAVVQTINGKKVWNLNCVLSGMGILKAHVDDESQTVLKMEKASFLDYVKKLPGGMLPGQNGMKGISEMNGNQVRIGKESEKEIKARIKNLNVLEEEIESEKKKYEEELKKKSSKKEKKEKQKASN